MAPEDTGAMSNLNRRQLVAGMGAAGIAGLAGCAGGDGDGGGDETDSPTDEGTDTPDETATPAQTYQLGGELIGTLGADLKNIDPTRINDTTSAKMGDLIYEGLTDVDFGGNPQPLLAEEVAIEGTSSTISLREGIQFHGDYGELQADDVVASFERYEGTTRESDVSDWYQFGSAEATDDYTVELELKQRYAPYKFSLAGVPMVPSEAADGDLNLAENPIGTGPFTWDVHEPDSFVRVQRNESYWGADFLDLEEGFPEVAPVETATFRVITEQSAQLAALRSGDVDLTNALPAGSISDLKENDDFTVTGRTSGGFDMFIYPTHPESGSVFQNQNLRLGVNRLIPRQAITDTVYNGIGQPAYAPVSPLAAAFTSQEFQQEMGDKYARFNQEKAAERLSQGIDELGVELPIENTIIVNQNPQRVEWCTLIQESMNQFRLDGERVFDIELNQFEWNTYVSKILAEDSHTKDQLVGLGWSAGWDPDAYVRNLFWGEAFTPRCCNINHYQNDRVDELIVEGTQTYDIEERAEIYDELQREIVKDSPMAFIRFGRQQNGFRTGVVNGFKTYPIDGAEYSGLYAPVSNNFTWVDKE